MFIPLPAQHHLDATGLLCPEPVMMLHRTMRNASPDDIIHMVATDPSTSRDVPKFCTFLGHELVEQRTHLDEQTNAARYEYWIRKGQKGM